MTRKPRIVGRTHTGAKKARSNTGNNIQADIDIPKGLNYPQFKIAYMNDHENATSKEVRRAWERYSEMSYGESDDEITTQKTDMSSVSDNIMHQKLDRLLAITLFPENETNNFVFSPYSISTAMTMIRAGSKGKTLKELSKFLGLDIGDTGPLEYYVPKGFLVSNRVWVADDVKLKQTYARIIKELYHGSIENIKFNSKAVQKINQAISDDTEGHIFDLFSTLDNDISLVLTNAVYFEGKWKNKFDGDLTHYDTFTTSNGDDIDVLMMRKRGKFKYAKNNGYQLLIMEYTNAARALFVLPKKPTKLDAPVEIDNWISSEFKTNSVFVKIPKFRLYHHEDITSKIKNLGVKSAFELNADFSNITSTPIYITQVIHAATIDVDEEGTIAAAATGMGVKAAKAKPEKFIDFHATHPFYFFLLSDDDNVVFAGKVEDPRGNLADDDESTKEGASTDGESSTDEESESEDKSRKIQGRKSKIYRRSTGRGFKREEDSSSEEKPRSRRK